MRRSTVHLICGSTGAGKTTYARRLCSETSGFVFSIDEWMKNLFWMDSPNPPNLDWALERVRRCEDQIWLLSIALAKRCDIVLDLGFSKQTQRKKFYDLVREAGLTSQLHYLDIPVDLRKKRVEHRNQQRTSTFEFEVDDKTFEWMENFFEPPNSHELVSAKILGVSDI